MGSSQQKQALTQKSDRQTISQLQSSINTLRTKFKNQISKLQSNSRKIKLRLNKVLQYSTSDIAKKQVIKKHLENSNEIQRYQKLDIHLEEAMYNIRGLTDADGLIELVKELAETMGIPYEAMKKVKELDEAVRVFQREIGMKVENYNVLESDEEEEREYGEGREDDRYQQQQQQQPVAGNSGDLGIPQGGNKMVSTFVPPKPSSKLPLTPPQPVPMNPAPMNNVILNNQGNQKVNSYVIAPVKINRVKVEEKDIVEFLHKLNPPPEEDDEEKSNKNSKEESVKNKKPQK